MSISPASSSTLNVAPTQQKPPEPDLQAQIKKHVDAFAKALKTDDVPLAKNSAVQLQEKLQHAGATGNGQNPGQTQLLSAVKALNETVRAGNLSGAKQAFAAVQQAQQNTNNANAKEVANKVVANATVHNPTITETVGRNINTRA